jgi:ankyrin repeat protein
MSVADLAAVLLAAARSGDLDAARAACEAGVSPVAQCAAPDAEQGGTTTPLHAAASAGNAAMVRLLLRAASSAASARDSRGRTALHCAASAGSSDACAALLEHGADVWRSSRGRAPPRCLRQVNENLRRCMWLRAWAGPTAPPRCWMQAPT